MNQEINAYVTGIVTKSSSSYVPINTPVKIGLRADGLPVSIHRIDNGGGTWLMSEYDMLNTEWSPINV